MSALDTQPTSETPTLIQVVTPPSPPPPPATSDLAIVSSAFLEELMRCQLVAAADVAKHFGRDLGGLSQCDSVEEVGAALVRAALLTDYQLRRILRGEAYGLVLDNNRVLGLLGSGSMGTVYLAEHMFMRRRVAVKVLPVDADCPPEVLGRFCSEMRVLAGLRHPHIVMAYDAGTLSPTTPDEPALLYLVLELVSGGDLQKYVEQHGPVPVPQACQWAYEAASGLQEAHDNHLYPPRRQALQLAAERGWTGQDCRFRLGAPVQQPADRATRRVGHGRVYGPGAKRGPSGCWQSGRHLWSGRDSVLVIDRGAPLPADQGGVASPGKASAEPAAPRSCPIAGCSSGIGRARPAHAGP